MTVAAGVDNKNLAVAVRAILAELARLKEPVPEAELNRAKELFKGRIWLRMEDSRRCRRLAGQQEILTGGILTVDAVTMIIEAVTAANCRSWRRSYW